MLRIDADVGNLDTIRNFVQQQAGSLGMSQAAVYGLILAVDEAATNIIVHGYRGKAGVIEITIEQINENLITQIRDWAGPFDPTTIPSPDITLPLKKRPLGGLGIHLIRKNVDEIIHSIPAGGGNVLTLKVRIPGGKND